MKTTVPPSPPIDANFVRFYTGFVKLCRFTTYYDF